MKLKGIVLAVILSLASIMMPFSVYADTITTNNIEGINTVLLSKTQNSANTNSYWYVYEHTITLDANYVGTINLNVNLTYYNPSGSSDTYGVATISNKNFYVNGNTIKINQMVVSDNYANQGPIASSSYLLNSSNVIKYDDIDSLQQVIDLLTDIYQNSEDIEGLSTNQLSELESIVYNTSLANDYLETISELRQYNFPIESFNFVYVQIGKGRQIVDLYNNGYYSYPIFKLMNNNVIEQRYVNRGLNYLLIFGTNKSISLSNVSDYLSLDNGTISNVELINLSTSFRFIKVTINNLNNESFVLRSIVDDFLIIPILSIRSDYLANGYFSTDFALQYGLSNQLLNDLHIIAQGTTQSNSAASDLESGNDQMADDMNDLANIESGYNQQFNDQLQSIDFTSPLQNNSGILPAANFVITIFNGLINNNPFSVLIIIVCILLIGKKVIGK